MSVGADSRAVSRARTEITRFAPAAWRHLEAGQPMHARRSPARDEQHDEQGGRIATVAFEGCSEAELGMSRVRPEWVQGNEEVGCGRASAARG